MNNSPPPPFSPTPFPSATPAYDHVIIGGGHNGLTAAAILAKAGRRVLVLEAQERLGGVAATEEPFPGFHINSGLSNAGMFRPEVVESLGLADYGLEFITSPVTAFAPQRDAPPLTLWRKVEKSQAAIAPFSQSDADRFAAFVWALRNLTERLDGLMIRTPPSLSDDALGNFFPWFGQAFGISRLDRATLADFLRVLPLSVVEFLDEWFEDDHLKATLGAAAVSGLMQGPFSPWTAFNLLYHYLGGEQTGFKASRSVKGGVGALSTALAQAAQAQGAEIRTGVRVSRILIDQDRVIGVALAEGEVIPAASVISSTDPRHTFFDLVGPTNLEVRFVRRVKNIRFRGCTAHVHLTLSGLPEFNGQTEPAQLGGQIIICPSLTYLERAYDEAKYGRISDQPYLEATLPTLLDPSLAPGGQHILSIRMQYAPYHLRDSTWAAERDRLGERVIDLLAVYAPNLPDLIRDRWVITPLDWEERLTLTEGSLTHGEMGIDQLLSMRPVPGYGQYRTPIEGLYLCGAGTHPGGGLTGAPGYNAAREILSE